MPQYQQHHQKQKSKVHQIIVTVAM